jgi:large subunit ribosomal protein L9
MEVILIQDVEGLGRRGDKAQVAPGYARNYLFPRGLALAATSAGAKRFAELERQRAAKANRERREAEKLAEALKKVTVQIPVQVGEDDRLFGSVTSADIAEALEAAGHKVDRRAIQLEEPLKTLGVYSIKLKLHPEVETKIKVLVKPKAAE